ncbi:hypothetical protein MMC17_004811 [Xylographa soralifera]|nr:hypothetical protein [Xylographa soralifera]
MTTVLVSGANKGIGKGFVEKYLSRPNTTVVATVRNTSAPDSKSLNHLPKANGSKLIVVRVESTSEIDAVEAVKSLESHGITKLDIVIANAGIFKLKAFQKVTDMQTADLMEHFNVNTAGVVRLFQATWPLLQKSNKPKFMVISSGGATIAGMEHVPWTISSYGSSKAAINYLTRRIHFENEKLIAFAVHPGAVQTEEGNAAARFFGLPEAFTTVKDSVDGLTAKLDAATREETSAVVCSKKLIANGNWVFDGLEIVSYLPNRLPELNHAKLSTAPAAYVPSKNPNLISI